MNRTHWIVLAAIGVLLLLPGCSRGSGTVEATLVPLGTGAAPVPTLDVLPGDTGGFEGLPGFGDPATTPAVGEITPVVPVQPPVATNDRFNNLRFAASSTGFEQANFPVGTEEIYAIWDYDDMREGDVMERLWYHDDQLYVERRESWDLFKYGFVGSVRDVYLFDYIDGIDPGRWRVELYLNGELVESAQFTVGSP